MASPLVSQRKNRWIVLLSVILVALISLIILMNQQNNVQQMSRILLPSEQAASIDIITNEELITLAKGQEDWQITHPVSAPADKQRVMAILSLLRLPDTTIYTLNQVNLQEVGLTSPLASVKINDLEFTFGLPGLERNKRYLRVNDSVYLADDIVYPLINIGVNGLTDGADSDSSTSAATD